MSTPATLAARPKTRPSSRLTSAKRPASGRPAGKPAGSPPRPDAAPPSPTTAGPRSGRPGGSLLRQLGPRGRFGPAIVAAVLMGLLGLMIGMNLGRPDWPGEGSAEVGFARDMAAHHAQAVEMGMIAFQKASSEDVRSLGADIATTQQSQIGVMYNWLDTWGVPRNTTDRPMAWVPGGEAMLNGNLMPGMATREEINELNNATGEQVDILFLQYMIRHHLGGVHMVEALLAEDPLPPVRALAEQMARNQGAEVILMQDMLREFGASPLPN